MFISLGKLYMRLLDALGWRARRVFGDNRIDRLLVGLARQWRPTLTKPVFIGITGSAGKSTTKELLIGVLSHHGRGVANPGTMNMVAEVAKTILQAQPWHSFCISEIGAHEPGAMDEPLALLQPSVGIVTVIANDHLAAYGSREAIAAEKGKLISSLPATGTAVINADDALVCGMAARCGGKVISYGISPTADLRAENITAAWPDRLSFTAVWGAQRVQVQTQLCGAHWIPAVLSAIGGGLATGMSLADCATGIAGVAPFEGRMQPVTKPEGVTFIRDDFKAPLWTLEACFEFMKAAKARRKIIVIGTLSDYGTGTGASKKYAEVARLAQEIADITVFIGPWASSVLKARKPGKEDALRVYTHVREAAHYLNSISSKGDLILLKGTTKQDHLLRIILAREDGIACWRDDCQREMFCNVCPERMKPSGAPLQHQQLAPVAEPGSDFVALGRIDQVIVGLGNPEAKYSNTPHNIGYTALDHLAASLRLTWDAVPNALIARGSLQGKPICLLKVQSAMNLTGGGLKLLSERLSFGPAQCILVYDDLDLPLGTVRTRLRGSAGGHRGVASILEAFQSDTFRRVKVGVGQAGTKHDRAAYVLTPFDASSRSAVDQAVATAITRTVELTATRARAP